MVSGEFSDDGAWVRLYAVTQGRTQPRRDLENLSWVMACDGPWPQQLNMEHAQAWSLCKGWSTVAEVAARMRMPMFAVKILLTDLLELGAAVEEESTISNYARDPESLVRLRDALLRL